MSVLRPVYVSLTLSLTLNVTLTLELVVRYVYQGERRSGVR